MDFGALNAASDVLLYVVLHGAIKGSFFFIVILVARFVFKLSVGYRLWALTISGFVFFTLQSGLFLVLYNGGVIGSDLSPPPWESLVQGFMSVSVPQNVFEPVEFSGIITSSSISFSVFIIGLWLAGVLVHTLLQLLGPLGLISVVRSSYSGDELRDRVSVHVPSKVRLRYSPYCQSPFSLVFANTAYIFLPPDFDDEPQEKITAIFLHELEHLRGRDQFWSALARIGCSFFWFFPPAWYAYKMLRLQQECRCDRTALVEGSMDPGSYAQMVLDYSRHSVLHRGPYRSLEAFATLAAIRIKRMFAPFPQVQKPMGRASFLVPLGLVIGLSLLYVGPQNLSFDDSPRAYSSRIRGALDYWGVDGTSEMLPEALTSLPIREPIIDSEAESIEYFDITLQRNGDGYYSAIRPGQLFLVNQGSLVRASGSGTVAAMVDRGLSGNAILIDHGNGLYSHYGNLSHPFSLQAGDFIHIGDPIGTVSPIRGKYLDSSGTTQVLDGKYAVFFSVSLLGYTIDPSLFLLD